MSNYPVHTTMKRLTIIGYLLLAIGLGLIFLHADINGPKMGEPLTIAGFVIGFLGLVLLPIVWVLGIRRGWIPSEPKLGEPRLRQQRKFSWVLSACLAVLYGYWTWQSWNDPHASGFPIWIAILWLPTLVFATGKRSIKRALEAQGGYPQDERERNILHTATFYAFYAAIVMLGAIATILSMAPAPSKFAIDTMFIAAVVIIISVRDFIAWRMGLR